MAIRLGLQEQETVIRYDEASDTATVFTYNRSLIADLNKRGAKGSVVGGAMEYQVPKNWVSVRPPKRIALTPEQREAKAAAMRRVRNGDKPQSALTI